MAKDTEQHESSLGLSQSQSLSGGAPRPPGSPEGTPISQGTPETRTHTSEPKSRSSYPMGPATMVLIWLAIGTIVGLVTGVAWSPRFGLPGQTNQSMAPALTQVEANGQSVKAPPGSTVRIVSESHSSGGQRTESGNAKAADIRSSSGDITSNLKTGAPALHLNGGIDVTGTSSEYSSTLTGKNDANVFYLMAVICLLGAGALFYFGQRKAAIVAAVCAGGLVATGVLITTYPWAILILVGVGTIGLGYWVWTERANLHLSTTLSHVLRGEKAIEDPVQKAAVKKATAASAAAAGDIKVVSKTITKAKATNQA